MCILFGAVGGVFAAFGLGVIALHDPHPSDRLIAMIVIAAFGCGMIGAVLGQIAENGRKPSADHE